MSVQQLIDVTGGQLSGPAPAPGLSILGVATDSRADCTDRLFVALKGPRFDGHDHVAGAIEKGAVATLLEHAVGGSVPEVIVDDTLAGLGQVAAAWRAAFDIPVIGITGSVGKTTVKELLGAILSRQGQGVITMGNLNNEIGVPLTLTRIGNTDEFAVIEMGMNHAGEISRLSQMSSPDVVLINNAAAAHLEGLGDVAAVAAAKGEILDGLRQTGTAVLNADDQWFDYWVERAGDHRVISFGLENLADITADYRLAPDGSDVTINLGADGLELRLPLPGRHNVMNALAATAAAVAIGTPTEAIGSGLESAHGSAGRLSIVESSGMTVLDDTYNANPASMRAALEVLAEFPAGRRIVVMGDMAELGDAAGEAHEEVGDIVRESGFDRLYALGPLSADAVRVAGIPAALYNDRALLAHDLAADIRAGDVVLVKGSRSMRMEEFVKAILEATGGNTGDNNAA